ncbi:sugar isomerase domain-containing protein [Thalassospira sp. NFXS8]|uniref:sugar isomerase domain-containing protein n=1 Tax=Thalassospira sp. NFXS8 TaxID=2819093 RepID=UPI0032DE3AED
MSSETELYHATIKTLMDKIHEGLPEIEKAATVMAKAIMEDKLIHVIGPGGHSNMGVEELLWRAGGLAPINAILDPGTNLIHGAKRSNIIERTHGYAKGVLDSYQVGKKPGEVIVIVNAYGVNAMCIDTLLEARKRGMQVIAVTSRSFADNLPADHPARHESGKNLYSEADYFLENHLPLGDAIVDIEGCDEKTGSTSTFCNVFVLNLLVIEAIRAIIAMDGKPPVWRSANMPGGDAANKVLEDKYIPRIRHLG